MEYKGAPMAPLAQMNPVWPVFTWIWILFKMYGKMVKKNYLETLTWHLTQI